MKYLYNSNIQLRKYTLSIVLVCIIYISTICASIDGQIQHPTTQCNSADVPWNEQGKNETELKTNDHTLIINVMFNPLSVIFLS
jgi:hypothetical protein